MIWPSGRKDSVPPHEFAAALAQLDAALAANQRAAAPHPPGGGGSGDAVSIGAEGTSILSNSNPARSSELIPMALSVLRAEIEAEATARKEMFTQAVCCLNIPSTQYRTLCFFEVAGLFAAAVLFASAETLKSTATTIAGASGEAALEITA